MVARGGIDLHHLEHSLGGELADARGEQADVGALAAGMLLALASPGRAGEGRLRPAISQ